MGDIIVHFSTILLTSILCHVFALQAGGPCRIAKSRDIGVCQEIKKCPEVLLNLKDKQHQLKDVICGWSPLGQRRHPYVCCHKNLKLRTSHTETYDASAPRNYYFGFNSCRYQQDNFRKRSFAAADGIPDIPWPVNGSSYNEEEPFNVQKAEIAYVLGGEDADPQSASTAAMALIGERKNGKNDWFCDGVLINLSWIVTAAHCFVRTPNIIRLGEYDLNFDLNEFDGDPSDYGVKQILIYPEYTFSEAYHDLALIELNTTISRNHVMVKPLCIPWSKDNIFPNLVNNLLRVSGWGATVYGGKKSSILQEVDVTVFDTKVCEQIYSKRHDFNKSWPRGMTSESTLCAGDEFGDKDACKGDSGGPLINFDSRYGMVLAGIVSKGNGCGLKEYPGIYTPIHNAKYLSWIKKTAFGFNS